MIIKSNSIWELKQILSWMYKGMCNDEDALNCNPACRVPESEHCKECFKDYLIHHFTYTVNDEEVKLNDYINNLE